MTKVGLFHYFCGNEAHNMEILEAEAEGPQEVGEESPAGNGETGERPPEEPE